VERVDDTVDKIAAVVESIEVDVPGNFVVVSTATVVTSTVVVSKVVFAGFSVTTAVVF